MGLTPEKKSNNGWFRRQWHEHRPRSLLISLLIVAILTASSLILIGPVKQQKTIGFTGYDLSHDFFRRMEIGILEESEKLGFKLISHDQQGDETRLVTSFKRLVSDGVDALIVSPVSPDVLPPLVDSAHARGIPVIINDIGGGGSNYDAIVISDNWQGGILAAEFTVRALRGHEYSRNVAIISVEPSAVYAARRGQAYRQSIEAAGFTVVKEISAYSRQEDAYFAMKLILEEHPDLVALFAENDPMAVGAANAAAELGRRDILIVGFNGDQIARDAISAGMMHATVAQDAIEMGRITVKLADRLIHGREIIFDDPEKREIYVPVRLLTAADIG